MYYKTRNRDRLLEYFSSLDGNHTTVGEIRAHFKRYGPYMGLATIYRLLSRMMDEGLVNRYILEPGGPACYEYTARECEREEIVYHCKCEKCGRMLHIHCIDISGVQKELEQNRDFRPDLRHTVFYGICSECYQD